MFQLVDLQGNPVLMRDGTPFTYTSRELARAGRGILQGALKMALRVVDAR